MTVPARSSPEAILRRSRAARPSLAIRAPGIKHPSPSWMVAPLWSQPALEGKRGRAWPARARPVPRQLQTLKGWGLV